MAHDLVSFRPVDDVKSQFADLNLTVIPRARYPENEIIEYVESADALFIHSENTYSQAVIESTPSLEVIGKAGSGIDNIDIEAATENGVTVVHVPGMNSYPVSEHTIGMLLALYRQFQNADEHLRNGGWRSEEWWGVELRGKTVGIIGLGAAGYETAKRLVPFGVDLVAHDPYVNEERADELGVELIDLDELLDQSDAVSLHVRLNEETRGLIGADEFARMHEDAILINTARGEVVEKNALIEALRAGDIGGAGLDVFHTEPPADDDPLFELDNIIVTPHLAGATQRTRLQMLRVTAENVVKVLESESVEEQFVANPVA
jgi:D-3-phosphoglycerate dehydrogenase